MDAVKVISSDVDFLIEQFQAIKHERKYVFIPMFMNNKEEIK